ncbi:GntR family transcriptional regulator [Alicyclobacillus sp. SO9]|uniref:GntR family transcriptional regulator n=1 Tax=Alicyclobacillus sp. SO9 TaxID=2665646 RepID=UPI0018E8B3ED|nr:GntR family transcriptional regulator [Alicyclobacillus sp. SO9]QQE78978.1 GntR family transcriptional regulator [Alicyclobacillus sp. SO9]
MDILIANSLDKPIYMQIVDQIINQIVSGSIKPGEALPSMRILAKDLKISVITTKRAYEELERDGYIESVVGKGTFVAGLSKDLLRERQMGLVERDLSEVIASAKRTALSKDEFRNMVDLLWDHADSE